MTNQTASEPTEKQFQCRHIKADGRRCQSPSLRQEHFCYYHHTTRRPIADPRARRTRASSFHLPMPEDRAAIQSSIGEVLCRIAAGEIDPRRAGLLLYGLQIASSNLPRLAPEPAHTSSTIVVEEFVEDPTHGHIAPRTELSPESEVETKASAVLRTITENMTRYDEQCRHEEEQRTKPATILPNLTAAASSIPRTPRLASASCGTRQTWSSPQKNHAAIAASRYLKSTSMHATLTISAILLLASSVHAQSQSKDVPVPTTCTPAVNAKLQDMIRNPPAKYAENVMACGIADYTYVNHGGRYGSHHIVTMDVTLPNDGTVTIQLAINDSLVGPVYARRGDHVFALGQGYITHGRWVAGIHDTHCSTHPTADNGWVVVNGVKSPTTCSR